MSKIYVCGDTHGNIDMQKIVKFTNSSEYQNDITKDDVMIQLGDWGGLWYSKYERAYKSEKKLRENWAKKKFTLAVIPGNHENYDLINDLPTVQMWGGSVHKLVVPTHKHSSKANGVIYLLQRGEIYTINGKKILAVGGAQSQDRAYRTQGESWWAEELLNDYERENTLFNLDIHNWEVDYVLTHTSPTSVAKRIIRRRIGGNDYSRAEDSVATFLQSLLDQGIKFKEWHYGHWHLDTKIDNYFCWYQSVPHRLI